MNLGLQGSAHHVHQPEEGDGSGGMGANLAKKEVRAGVPEQPSHHPDTGSSFCRGKS